MIFNENDNLQMKRQINAQPKCPRLLIMFLCTKLSLQYYLTTFESPFFTADTNLPYKNQFYFQVMENSSSYERF